jgi:hypothetical protein
MFTYSPASAYCLQAIHNQAPKSAAACLRVTGKLLDDGAASIALTGARFRLPDIACRPAWRSWLTLWLRRGRAFGRLR